MSDVELASTVINTTSETPAEWPAMLRCDEALPRVQYDETHPEYSGMPDRVASKPRRRMA